MGWSGVPTFLSDILAVVVVRGRYLVQANTRDTGAIERGVSLEAIWTGEIEIGGIVGKWGSSIYTLAGQKDSMFGWGW
jgi:hypothetical protein